MFDLLSREMRCLTNKPLGCGARLSTIFLLLTIFVKCLYEPLWPSWNALGGGHNAFPEKRISWVGRAGLNADKGGPLKNPIKTIDLSVSRQSRRE